jgi:L,D-peptidoglycan transpeptidase YkuD (ErfK/YbiS/YcfS/YnhG family)
VSRKAARPQNRWTLVRAPGRAAHHGLLRTGSVVYRCRIGRSGISVRKREGDGATPAGMLPVLGGYRKPGLGFGPATRRLRAITDDLGWCDAPKSPRYNRPVELPFAASHEKMLRPDRLYDVCLVLDWNVTRRARNRGSAIFLHLTRPDGGPTEGCIAIDPALMRRLLPRLLSATAVTVKP